MTECTAALTKPDWSPTASSLRLFGSVSFSFGSNALTLLMTSSVETEPALMIDISTALLPSTRTMLICGGEPS